MELVEVGGLIEESQGYNYPPTKCDICDVTFKCDLDVSRHLTSDVHIRNRDNFASNVSQRETNTRKYEPKNVAQLLQLLKIKNLKDIEHLADRGYFKISTEPQASLASELSRHLLAGWVRHGAKDLPPEIKHEVLEAANVNDTDQNCNKPEAPSTSTSNQQTSAPPRSVAPRPEQSMQPPRQSVPKQSVPKPSVAKNQSKQSTPRQRQTPPATAAPAPKPSSSTVRKPTNVPKLYLPQQQPPPPPTAAPAKRVEQQSPQPKKDSPYIPKLAIIKVEPKY